MTYCPHYVHNCIRFVGPSLSMSIENYMYAFNNTLVDSRLNIGINNKVGLPHVLRQIDIFYENNHASSNIHKCAPYLVSGFLPAYLLT